MDSSAFWCSRSYDVSVKTFLERKMAIGYQDNKLMSELSKSGSKLKKFTRAGCRINASFVSFCVICQKMLAGAVCVE